MDAATHLFAVDDRGIRVGIPQGWNGRRAVPTAEHSDVLGERNHGMASAGVGPLRQVHSPPVRHRGHGRVQVARGSLGAVAGARRRRKDGVGAEAARASGSSQEQEEAEKDRAAYCQTWEDLFQSREAHGSIPCRVRALGGRASVDANCHGLTNRSGVRGASTSCRPHLVDRTGRATDPDLRADSWQSSAHARRLSRG